MNQRENPQEDAALHAARYHMAQSSQQPLPVDEYAEATGMKPVEKTARTPLQFHAEDEAWEVANTALDEAFARGDFDNLALAGKNIDSITRNTDPDWWLKSMMHREKISGLGPPALTLRVEDRQMDETLDRLPTEAAVRVHLEDFNRRVIEARRQLQGGPPVVTALREVDAEVQRWTQRRNAQPVQGTEHSDIQPRKRRWWRRRSD